MTIQRLEELNSKYLNALTKEEQEEYDVLKGDADIESQVDEILAQDTLKDAQDRDKAIRRFKKDFIKKSYQHKVFKLTKKDVKLLKVMASENVNWNNRKKNHDGIDKLYRCLVADYWFTECNDIYIDIDGKLKNGQHTIDALINLLLQADDDYFIMVGFKLGVHPDCILYLDMNRPRNPLDTLQILIDGNRFNLNKNMKDVVKFKGREDVHDHPFRRAKALNSFEMQNVVNSHQELLHKLFGELGFPRQDWNGGIRYALFRLGLEHEDLAIELAQEIRSVHSENADDEDSPQSDYAEVQQEHDIIEHCRSVRYSERYKYSDFRPQNYYDKAVEWILEEHAQVDGSAFSFAEDE